jgi:hypothetical protein
MKKICGVVLALVVIGGLSAQEWEPPPKDWGVTITGYGRGAFAPIQYAGEIKDANGDVTSKAETNTGIGASWGYQYLKLGLTVNAGSDAIGVHADVQFDKTTLGLGDDGYVYIKPFSFISTKFGKYVDATLGGKIGSTDFHMFVLPEKNEDAIFTRFLSAENTNSNVSYKTTFDGARASDATTPRAEGEIGQKGFLLLLSPVKGLTLGLNLPSMGQAVYSAFTENNGAQWGNPQSPAEYVWGNAQIAAGYEIKGIGTVRAQYVGVKDGYINADGDWKLNDYVYYAPNSRIEAAFALTAVQGLTLDFGFKYYLPSDQELITSWGETWSDYAKGMAIGLGAKYAGGGFNGFGKGAYAIEGRIDGGFGGKYKTSAVWYGPDAVDAENGINLNVHLSPSYNLGICTVGGDFGLELQTDSKTDGTEDKTGYTRFGAGAWIQRDLGVAKYIKIGVGAALPYKTNGDEEYGVVVSVPIVFQFVFF